MQEGAARSAAGSSATRKDTGLAPQPARRVLERTYEILMLHRRLVRDYEIRPASSEPRVYWAMTNTMTRRLTGESAPSWRQSAAVVA
ncbi:hypothetical protein ACFV2N_28540 [Streptomyces sp. NPDC059680]|uniref:hypothetical protein n=1 Tax=Streptomyces sp. NPDC059680 TaxID=3346904 RepID=UPI003688F5EE